MGVIWIREQCKKKQVSYDKALLAMVANSLCSPESKRDVWHIWLETVYLPECNDFKLHRMYEAMDRLHEHAERVEKQIFFVVANLLNLSVDIKMMPMCHWLSHRIETHVKICMFALFIERVAELKCGKPWSKIKSRLSKMQATEFTMPGHDFTN